MKLSKDLSLQLDIFEEDGQVQVFIAEENSTGSTTSNVKSMKDITTALEEYLHDYCEL